MPPATVKHLESNSSRESGDIHSVGKPTNRANECLDVCYEPSHRLSRNSQSLRRQGSESPGVSSAEVIGTLTAGVLTCRRNAFSMDTLPMRRDMRNGELVYWSRSVSEVEPVIRAIQTWKRGFRRKQSEAAAAAAESQSVERNVKNDGATMDIIKTICSSHEKKIREETLNYQQLWRKAIHIVWTLSWRLRDVQQQMFLGLTFRRQLEDVPFSSANSHHSHAHHAFFDPHEFTADRQMRMSSEAKRILGKLPDDRTEQEIGYVTIALRSIRLISDYPLRMQQNLAKYGRMDCYDGGRLVLKEGHRPLAFYFIFHGSVMVAVLNEETGEAETKRILRRDDSFGELAIMSRSARHSTIITKTYTELLSIDLEVYEQIFMDHGRSVQRNITDPDHQQFVEHLSFLKGWPTQLLISTKDPKLIVFAYFKRGSVIVKDSNQSEWLYVVKSGSACVLKKLVASNRKSIVDFREPSLIRRLIAFQQQTKTGRMKAPDGDDPNTLSRQASSLDASSKRKKHVRLRTQSAFGKSQSPDRRFRSPPKDIATTIRRPKTTASTAIRTTQQTTIKLKPILRNAQAEVSEINDRRRSNDLQLDPTYKPPIVIEGDGNRNPVFVRLQTLTKSDVFGLQYLVFKNQPSLSLISNGAECIMISKQFYLDNCTQQRTDQLCFEVSPFPSDENLQICLEEKTNWLNYKDSVVNDLYSKK